MKIQVECVGCGNKITLEGKGCEEQPFCNKCGMPMIVKKVTRIKEKKK